MREEYHQAPQKLFGFFPPLFPKNKNRISHFSSTQDTLYELLYSLGKMLKILPVSLLILCRKFICFKKNLTPHLLGDLVASKHRGAVSTHERKLWVEAMVGDNKSPPPIRWICALGARSQREIKVLC